MRNVQPLNRQVEIKIGPLREWEGGGSEDAALRIYGDGTNNNLRIKFSVPKHIISTTSATTISVYNLSPGSRSSLQKSHAQIVLKAGWANVGLLSIFRGSLHAVVTRRDGPDIVTDLLCLAAIGATSRTVISKSFGSNFQLSEMLSNIAKEFPGVDVDKKLIKVKNISIGKQGYSFAGAATELLDKLARVHGFSWWISDGRFYALDDDVVFGVENVVISSNNGFLLRAEQMLVTPWQKQLGTTIKSLLNPFIIPGGSVFLNTRINPILNGSYKVHSLTHSGDTHADDWTTEIQSYLIGGV